VLSLGQTPLLAAFAQYRLQALAQALLVALQLRHKATTVLQFTGCWQAGQLGAELLLPLLQCIGTLIQGLQVFALPLLAALQLANLPDAPAADRDASGAQQQRQQRQAVAGASGGLGGGRFRRFERRGLFGVGQDSFAHVSILCMVAHRFLA